MKQPYISSVQEQIIRLDFINAYNTLCENHYAFEFDNLVRDFPKLNSCQMYMFLMYAISQNEDVDKHLAICNYLYFAEPYITNADSLIKWHLIQALKISPNDDNVLKNWVFGIYGSNPDCPFDDNELADFKNRIK